MPVVADVHADPADGGLEHRVAEVPRSEVELLPEALDLRDVGLAVLAQVGAVGIDHRSRVVEQALLLLLVHRQDQDHAVLCRQLLETPRRRPIRDGLGVVVVVGVLHLAEVGAVEELLEAHDPGSGCGSCGKVLLVELDHRLLVARPPGLEHRRPYLVRHLRLPGLSRPMSPGDAAVGTVQGSCQRGQ